jgi:hypothetical protein
MLLLALIGAIVAAIVAYDDLPATAAPHEEWDAFLAAHTELYA